MSDNIIVAVRVRPLISREEADKSKINWEVNEDSIVQIDPISKKKLGSSYSYDKVFSSSSATEDVHNSVTKPIVEAAISGFNGTIFAYGQTSSGKTFTMMGNKESQGIIPLSVKDIFTTIENTPDREYLMRASYMEIYKENITDLLSGKEGRNKVLSLREDGAGIVYVADLKEECVTQEGQLISLIQKGDKWRHVGSTNMNERSSRSHTIFRLIIESRERGDGLESDDSAITVSHLNLVDLAGSENVSQTGATGDRLKEGGFINKSLFMLGRVISQLSDGETFVNFRDSKLTRILQAALGGNAKTAIICTVTPAGIEQTHSTLRFASRAKSVKNKPVVNEVLSDAALLKRYMREINQLKEALENEKKTNKAQEVEVVREKLGEQERRNKEMQDKIKQLSEKLVVSSHAVPLHQGAAKKKNRRETWAAPAIQRFMRKSAAGLEIEHLKLDHDFLKPAVPSMRRELPRIEEDLSFSDISWSTNNSSVSEENFGVNIGFGTPTSVAKRKKKKRVHFHSSPSSPVKSFSNVECQTDESLLPKFSITNPEAPSSPRLSDSLSQVSSPETPVHVLRTRNADLQNKLGETTEYLDNLKEEMEEMCDFHANELILREESFRSKIADGADLNYIQELQKKINSLEHSQRDTEGLLIDANRCLAQRSQELILCKENCEHMKNDLDKHSNAFMELETLKVKFNEINQTLEKKCEQLDQMEKDRKDFDTIMELALEKKTIVENDLRKSLQEAWSEIAVLEGNSQEDVQRRFEQLQTLEKELEILREKTTKQTASIEKITHLEDQLADLTKKLEESNRKITEYELEKEMDDKRLKEQASELEELRMDLEYSRAQVAHVAKDSQRILSPVAEKYEESVLEDPMVDGKASCSELPRSRSLCLSHLEVSNKLSETLQVLEESILNSSVFDSLNPDFVTLPIGLSDLEMLRKELLVLQEALISQEKEKAMTQSLEYQSWAVADYERVAAVWRMQENFSADYLLYSNSQALYSFEQLSLKKNVPCALDIEPVDQVAVVKGKELVENHEENLQNQQTHNDAPLSKDIYVEEDTSCRNITISDIALHSLADELREADMEFTLNMDEVLGTCDTVRPYPLQELQSLRERFDIISKENSNLSAELLQLKEKIQDDDRNFRNDNVFSVQLKGFGNNEEYAHKEKLQSENEYLAKRVLQLEQEVQEERINEEEIHCLRWKVESLKTEKLELDNQLSVLKEESVRKDLYEEVKRELYKAEETIKGFEKGNVNTKTELDEKDEEMERLITDFMMKEEKYEHDIANLDNERAQIKRQFIDEELKMKKLEKILTEQEDKLKTSLGLLATRERENEELSSKCDVEKIKVETLEEKLANYQDEIVKLRGLVDSHTDVEEDLTSVLRGGKDLKQCYDNVHNDFQEKKEEYGHAEEIFVNHKEVSEIDEEKGALESSYSCVNEEGTATNGEHITHEKMFEESEAIMRNCEEYGYTKEDFSKKERKQSALEQICDDLERKLREKDDLLSKFEDKILHLELNIKTPQSVLEDEKQEASQQNIYIKDKTPKKNEGQNADNENCKELTEPEKKGKEQMILKKVFADFGESFYKTETDQYDVEQIYENLRGKLKEMDEGQTNSKSKILSLEEELKATLSSLEDVKLESSRLDMLLKEELAKNFDQQIIQKEKFMEVTEELEKKNADIVVLENTLADLREEFSKKVREFSAVEKVNEDFNEKLKEKGNLEAENLSLKKDLKTVQSVLEDEKQKVSQLDRYIKEELAKKDHEQDMLKDECKKLTQELEKKAADQILLEQTLADLREEVSRIGKEWKVAEEICSDLRVEVKEKDEVQTTLEAKILDLEKELKASHSVLEDKKIECSNLDMLLKEELGRKNDQEIKHKEKFKEVTEELEKKNADLVLLEKAFTDLKEDFTQKMSKCSALEKVTEDLDKKLKEKSYLEAQNCNLEEVLKTTQSDLESRKQEVSRLNTYITEELSKKDSEQDTLKEKCKKLAQDLDKKDDEKIHLEQALADLKENVSKKEKEHNVVEHLYSDLRVELKEKDAVQANSEAKILNLEEDLKAIHSILEDEKLESCRQNMLLKEELAKKSDELTLYEEKCKAVAEELERKNMELDLLEKAFADLKEDFTKKEKENFALEKVTEDLHRAFKEKDVVQSNMEEEILNLQKNLKATQSVMENERQELCQMNKDKEVMVALLEEELQKHKDMVEELSREIGVTRKEVASLKMEMDKLEKENLVLEGANSKLSEEIKDIIKKHNIEIDRLTQKELQLEREMKAIHNDLEESGRKYDQSDKDLNDTFVHDELHTKDGQSSLRTGHFENKSETEIKIGAETEMLQRKLLQVEKELEEKNILLQEKNQECEKLSKEVNNLTTFCNVEESKSNAEIEDLKRQISSLNGNVNKELVSGDGKEYWCSLKSSERSDILRDLETRVCQLENEHDQRETVLEEVNREYEADKEVNDLVELKRNENSSIQMEDLKVQAEVENMSTENITLKDSGSSNMNEVLGRLFHLENELKRKEELLDVKSRECQRLDEEMDDLVAHYKEIEKDSYTQIEDLRDQVLVLESEMKKQNSGEKIFSNMDKHLAKEAEKTCNGEKLHAKMFEPKNEQEKMLEENGEDCMHITDEMADQVNHYKEKESSSSNHTGEGRFKGSAIEGGLKDVAGMGCLDKGQCATCMERSGFNNELQANITRLENELEKREQILEEKNKECKCLTDEMAHLIERYREKDCRSDIQIQELRRQVSLLEKKLNKVLSEKGIVGVKSSSTSEELQARLTQLESELEQRERILEEKNECRRLNEEMDDLVAHYKEEEKKNDAQIEHLRRQVSAWEKELKKSGNEKRLVEEYHHSVGEEEKSCIHNELQESTFSGIELKKREEMLEEKTKECKHLKDLLEQYREKENLSGIQIQELLRQVVTLEKELKNALTSEKGAVVKGHHQNVGDVEKSNVVMVMQAKVSQLENQLEQKQKMLEEKDKECKRLDEEMDDLVAHYKEEEEKSYAQIDDLRGQVSVFEEELRKQCEVVVEGCLPVRETEVNVEQNKELLVRRNKNENVLGSEARMLEEKEGEGRCQDREIADHVQNTTKNDNSSGNVTESFRNQVSTSDGLKCIESRSKSDKSLHLERDIEKSKMNTKLTKFASVEDGTEKKEIIEHELQKRKKKQYKHKESKHHQETVELGTPYKEKENTIKMQIEDPEIQTSALEENMENTEERRSDDDSSLSIEGGSMKFVGRLSLNEETSVESERICDVDSCNSLKENDSKSVGRLSFSEEASGKSQELGLRKSAPLKEENITSLGHVGQEIGSGNEEAFYKMLRENNVLKMRLKAMDAPALKELHSVKAELRHSHQTVQHLKAELRRIQRSQNMNTTIYEINAHRITPAPTSEPGGSSKKFDFSGGQSGIVLESKVIELQNQMYHLEKDMNKVKREREILKEHVEHFKAKALEWKTNCIDARQHLDECEEKLLTYEQEKQTCEKKIDEENAEKLRLQFTIGHQRELIEKLEKEQLKLKNLLEKSTSSPSWVINKNILQEQERNAQANVTEDSIKIKGTNSLPQRMNVVGRIRERLPVKIQSEIPDGIQKENISEVGQKQKKFAGAAGESRIPARYLMAPRSSTSERDDECKTQ